MKMKMKMRNKTEIQKVEQELYEKLWLLRHLQLKHKNKDDLEKFYETHPREKEQEISNKLKDDDDWIKHESDILKPSVFGITLYEYELEGKLSSIRWVLGHEWDMLDT